MNTLFCTKCRESKDETLFPVNRSRRSGRGSWCKQCVAAGVSAYQRTAAGKAKIAARRAGGIRFSATLTPEEARVFRNMLAMSTGEPSDVDFDALRSIETKFTRSVEGAEF